MNDDRCCEVPLTERLRSVGKEWRVIVEESATCSRSIPCGPLMHDAADEIELLRAQVAEGRGLVEETREVVADFNIFVGSRDDLLERIDAYLAKTAT